MGREAIKIPQIRSVYGDQIICDGGPFGVGRQGGEYVSPYYPVGADCVLYHAYWSGDATDHSSYGNDGNVTGATFVTNALSFDGTDDEVSITDDASLDLSVGISIFAWVQFVTATGSGNYPSLLGKDYNTAYALFFDGNTRKNRPYLNGSGDAGAVALNYDTWYLLTFSFTPIVGGQPLTGKKRTTINTVEDLNLAYAGASIATNNRDLYIGSDGANEYHWPGLVGEILLFNVIKYDADILAYYNATKARYGL